MSYIRFLVAIFRPIGDSSNTHAAHHVSTAIHLGVWNIHRDGAKKTTSGWERGSEADVVGETWPGELLQVALRECGRFSRGRG
jgi:hypothetical protein